jgi:hypothetical protein
MEVLHIDIPGNESRTEVHGNNEKAVHKLPVPQFPFGNHIGHERSTQDIEGCAQYGPSKANQNRHRQGFHFQDVDIIGKMDIFWDQRNQPLGYHIVGAHGIDENIIEGEGTYQSKKTKKNINKNVETDITQIFFSFH